jgi:hypothetical protein
MQPIVSEVKRHGGGDTEVVQRYPFSTVFTDTIKNCRDTGSEPGRLQLREVRKWML